jgi:tRNA(Ile)-lysidine synthetase-like protein
MNSSDLTKSIIDFWFNNTHKYQEKWFDGSVDELITEKYAIYLQMAERGELNDMMTTKMGKLALIILFDQFSRNIYRGTDQIRKNDHLALPIAIEILSTSDDLNYSLNMRIFILLPLRHTHTTPNLDFVMKKIVEYDSMIESSPTFKDDTTLLKRFKNATISDYSKAIDTIYFSDRNTAIYPVFTDVIDNDCKKYVIEDDGRNILQKNEKILSHQLYKTVKKWVDDNIIMEERNIGVSLSGGVDSMVLMYIFYQMQLHGEINKIVAMHIDYTNRNESTMESEFVEKWSNFFDIPFYSRRIEHINRRDPDLDRDVYETVTKNIRFGLYRYVMKKENISYICLGHHNDDLAENVLMNFLRGRDLLDLFVMGKIVVNDQVKICRPMLDDNKDMVFDIAHIYYIPYMKDTTAEDCFRGVLRRKIVPAIKDFSSVMYLNLIKQGEQSFMLSKIVKNSVFDPIVKSIVYEKLGFKFPITDSLMNLFDILNDNEVFSFWVSLLSVIFHNNKHKMISHRSLKHLLYWIKNMNDDTCVRLSNGYNCSKNTNILYFFDQSIMNSRFTIPEHIDIIDTTNIVEIKHGIWTITLTPIIGDLWIKEKITHNDILKGEYSYTLPVNSDNKFFFGYNLNKKVSSRKIFTGLTGITRYVLKVGENFGEDRSGRFIRVVVKN